MYIKTLTFTASAAQNFHLSRAAAAQCCPASAACRLGISDVSPYL